MAKTARKIPESLEQMLGEDLKDDKLDKRIRYILRKVQAFAEIGQEGIEFSWGNKMPIIPLCRAIKDNLAELEELILNHPTEAKADLPEEKLDFKLIQLNQ